MPHFTSLRRELLSAFAIVFAGALIVAVAGHSAARPHVRDAGPYAWRSCRSWWAADLAGLLPVRPLAPAHRVLFPLDRMIEEAEAIAGGDYARRIPAAGSAELDRLSTSLNRMAERLINHQMELARNIESLERTNRDLTDARDELIRAEKMASLGQMAAGVAHEIGNPLSAVMGNVDLLKRGAEAGGEAGGRYAGAGPSHRPDRDGAGGLRPGPGGAGPAHRRERRRPEDHVRLDGVPAALQRCRRRQHPELDPGSLAWRRTRTSSSRCW
jgi:signal transduction histidine kinase